MKSVYLARYRELIIDAYDVDRMSRFWARALGLQDSPPDERGGVALRGHDREDLVWIQPLVAPRQERRRIHLDVYAQNVVDLLDAGADLVDQNSFPWDLLTDPEDREVGVFVLEHDRPKRMYQLVIDSPHPEANAAWWGKVLGAPVHPVPEDPTIAFVEPVPHAPFESILFAQEQSPKTCANGIAIGVEVLDPDILTLIGASVVDQPDHRLWMVLADPDGNEFYAYPRAGETW